MCDIEDTMGLYSSKKVENNGDPQVTIINHLENHAKMHEAQQIALSIMLVLVVAFAVLKLYRAYKECTKVQALKAARAAAVLQATV